MPIDFQCAHCGVFLRVDDSLAGKAVTCYKCRQVSTAPTASVPVNPEGAPSATASGNPYSAPVGNNPHNPYVTPGYPGHGASSSLGDDPGVRLLLPVGRSPWAIIAGYLGLLSALGCFAPFAVIFGVIALIDIKKNPKKHGLVRAWFGIIMGGLVTTLIIVVMIIGAAQG